MNVIRPHDELGQVEANATLRYVQQYATDADPDQPVQVKVLAWDGAAFAVYGDPFRIGDASHGALIGSGALFWIVWKREAQRWMPIIGTSTETYRLIRGLVKGDVTADDATFVIDNVVPLAGGLDPVSGNPATEITVQQSPHDRFTEAFEDNTPITAIWDGANWELVAVERYRSLRGKAVGAVSGGSATFTVDEIKVLASGCDPRTDPTSTAETVTVNNRHSQSYADNELVEADYNVVDNTWDTRKKAATTGSLFVCTLDGAISGGNTSNMGTGEGTVYSIGAGSGLTSVGTRTIFNPFLVPVPATAPGGTLIYTCIKTHDDATDADDEFTITGIDPLYLLASLNGFAQYKILWAGADASPTATDIEWASELCEQA